MSQALSCRSSAGLSAAKKAIEERLPSVGTVPGAVASVTEDGSAVSGEKKIKAHQKTQVDESTKIKAKARAESKLRAARDEVERAKSEVQRARVAVEEAQLAGRDFAICRELKRPLLPALPPPSLTRKLTRANHGTSHHSLCHRSYI